MTDRQLRRLAQSMTRNINAAAEEVGRERVVRYFNRQAALIASGALKLDAEGQPVGGCGDGGEGPRRERARVATAGDADDADDRVVAARRRVAASRKRTREARQDRDGSPGDRGDAGTPAVVTRDVDGED